MLHNICYCSISLSICIQCTYIHIYVNIYIYIYICTYTMSYIRLPINGYPISYTHIEIYHKAFSPPHPTSCPHVAASRDMGWGGVGWIPYGWCSVLDIRYWMSLSLSTYLSLFSYVHLPLWGLWVVGAWEWGEGCWMFIYIYMYVYVWLAMILCMSICKSISIFHAGV